MFPVKDAWKLLEDQPQKFIGWTRPLLTSTPFPPGFICVTCRGKVGDSITLNILSTTRAMLMNFCIVNIAKCQILISGCKVFCWFRQIFIYEKVKKMNYITKSNHFPIPTPSVTPLSYSGVLRVKYLFWKSWYSWRIFGMLTNRNR